MNDEQLLRYSRQIMLPSIGIEGQQRLLDASVLLIGLGGLGAPVAMYLAAAGIGRLTLVDFDQVDLSNLQRQIIHTTDRIGTPKVESAKQALAALNPEIEIECIGHQLEGDELSAQIQRADLVVDACDNFATRFAINAACHENSTPLVSGAAIRMEGQVSVFPGKPGSPCYRCLYPENGQVEDTCTANGVLAPVVGIIGSIQATEAIKCLTGAGSTLEGQLLILDALHMQWRSLKLKADPHCPVCS
ncbi:MAG: molybdopterin-synthase adenylyltransferase [Gammaproteobacteria bacterium (ex Lamellibrachia satsuma)]|nr:MAG: molybdopterin-synthase adenylyltransferase MoeB [Gammaproteobacteria bacterium (ex Lamellibrachia satsuma)]RRS33197.1 MAG: molybdopterin-synthase adenylyltransferase [Gammaproteobacteria bacterium (ex Lamellibrachia satsuma)]RRS36342.1 MAG: molybdopterin-synthase adenylyltransferase [Gammaproteobacteria bacterium (ex Lamellibrachia satsuma)]